MSTAILGQTYVFNVLFLNAAGEPVVVTTPMVQVFRFAPSGNKVVLTTTAMNPVSGDPGRYTFPYVVPASLAAGDNLYGLMYGVDPDTLDTLRVQVDVSLVAPPTYGLVSRFIQ